MADRALEGLGSCHPLPGITPDDLQGSGSCEEAGVCSTAQCEQPIQGIVVGLKRLTKVEKKLEEKRKQETRRYNKSYPGELVHFDTKRLPFFTGEDASRPGEYLFVGIDDFSRELYAGIYPDKTQYSSAAFLQQVLEECPYTIEYSYSDNGKEYKGTENHAFVALCKAEGLGQKFTRCNRPQTNGKAERVIRTLMEMWHTREVFKDRKQRRISLLRFINFHNTVKPHKGIDGMTPYEKLYEHFYGPTNL